MNVPRILFVNRQPKFAHGSVECGQVLEGSEWVENLLPANGEETEVAVYEFLRVEKYKKVMKYDVVITKVEES